MVMLCDSITKEEFVKRNDLTEWIVERKYDGIRASFSNGKILNRRGKDMTSKFPELATTISKIPFGIELDGEIVAQSHEFSDISGRIHFKDEFLIRLASKRSPAKFVVFDYIQLTKEHDWLTRRDRLESFNLPENFELSQPFEAKNTEEIWTELVLKNSWEGLVAKRKDSMYEFGMRSFNWLKIKAFKEVEHKFTKYEVNPRGLTLEDDDGRRVAVNGAQAKEVVDSFKKKGCVVAQVQYLPQRSGEWRFPSFRGITK